MDSSSRAQAPEDGPVIPENGDLYRHLCPVDHRNNTVHLKGLRAKNSVSPRPILFVHDVGENAGMYWDCLAHVCDKGFSSYVYDQRGHGRTSEISGHLDHFQDLVRDLLQVASWVRHMHNGESPIIVGQGYGALVATEFASRHPGFLRGLVLTAPTLQLAWTPGPIKRFIINLISKIAPTVRVPKGLHPRFSNPLHREMGTTIATRIIYSILGPRQSRVTFAFARELFESMESFGNHFRRVKVPTLILKPGADEVARYEVMDQIAATHQNQSLITSRTLANVHHNGFTEGPLPMASILDEIIGWGRNITARAQDKP
jgi:alpha-beta hydrolase superfamily lysophospholipase